MFAQVYYKKNYSPLLDLIHSIMKTTHAYSISQQSQNHHEFEFGLSYSYWIYTTSINELNILTGQW